jgi:hypothetical protein
MIRIEDDEYGVLYLAPLTNGWYTQFGDWIDYNYFFLIKNKKVVEATRDIPQCVWDKIKNA